ncbi:hypothetical protein EYC84_001049 [Monilinia fructicola]|uniref:Uncharacterized protein n=1 Tax=Monilinia fructicola TaxID=38448 RepID=A0A5M9JIU3_MONFR|nr:hypothetical protein EYC84_001049 [Monilinia fructicola]
MGFYLKFLIYLNILLKRYCPQTLLRPSSDPAFVSHFPFHYHGLKPFADSQTFSKHINSPRSSILNSQAGTSVYLIACTYISDPNF